MPSWGRPGRKGLSDCLETLVYKDSITNTTGLYSMAHISKNRETTPFHLRDIRLSFREPNGTIADIEDFGIQLAIE